MTKIAWVWPLSLLSSAIIATLVTFVFPETALRPVIIMSFLFVCPGAVLTRFLQIKEIAVEWMLALALSFALDATMAGLQLYARLWSPTGTLSILISFCFVGALVQIALLFSRKESFPGWIRILHLNVIAALTSIVKPIPNTKRSSNVKEEKNT